MSENRSEWALGYARRKLPVPFERKRSFIRKEQTGLLWDGQSGFSSLFFPFGLDTNFLDLAFRFPEGGEEKAFAPCLMREEAGKPDVQTGGRR